MKTVNYVLWAIIISLCANVAGILIFANHISILYPLLLLLASFVTIWLICRPQKRVQPNKRLQTLSDGSTLLKIYLISLSLTLVVQIFFAWHSIAQMFPWHSYRSTGILFAWSLSLLCAILCESAVFWGGILRLYVYSTQLGLKYRMLGGLLLWIPVVHIVYLVRMIHIVDAEVEIEAEKILLDNARIENEICKTKYPILFVHGVFFRDSRYFNYWGRIPNVLRKNGASIYYGKQQSASSVDECGKELAARIDQIVKQSGCEKVNIIAHSKGGLDSRAAISKFGAAPYVASLTTINTPHHGCLFADYLLSKVPQKACLSIAKTYNRVLCKLGDHQPDFLCAVQDLTAQACEAHNEAMPDAPGVLYESVMSYCKNAKSGQFPLNMSYHLAKHFDGENDGLVSVPSAQWGSHFTLLAPHGKRGISHGDMIDLNRENIPDFDVREFYVSLVSDLKKRGY